MNVTYHKEPYHLKINEFREGDEKNILYVAFDIWQNDALRYKNSVMHINVHTEAHTLTVSMNDDACTLPPVLKRMFALSLEHVVRRFNEDFGYFRFKDNKPIKLHEENVPTYLHHVQISIEIDDARVTQLQTYCYAFHLLRMSEELANHQHCWFDWSRIKEAYRTGSVSYYWSICRDVIKNKTTVIGVRPVPVKITPTPRITPRKPPKTWEDEMNSLLEQYKQATDEEKTRIESALNELKARYERIQKPFE